MVVFSTLQRYLTENLKCVRHLQPTQNFFEEQKFLGFFFKFCIGDWFFSEKNAFLCSIIYDSFLLGQKYFLITTRSLVTIGTFVLMMMKISNLLAKIAPLWFLSFLQIVLLLFHHFLGHEFPAAGCAENMSASQNSRNLFFETDWAVVFSLNFLKIIKFKKKSLKTLDRALVDGLWTARSERQNDRTVSFAVIILGSCNFWRR